MQAPEGAVGKQRYDVTVPSLLGEQVDDGSNGAGALGYGAALCQELNAIGVDVQEAPDGFMVTGGEVPGGNKVDSHGDHRLAMALAVSGLTAQEPVTVENAGIVDESFPDFIFALRSLGAHVDLEAGNRGI